MHRRSEQFSRHHSGSRNPNLDDRHVRAETQPGVEVVRTEVEYRGFLIRRGSPDAGYMWNIYDVQENDIPGMGGSFTKLPLATAVIDRWIKDREQEKELHERIEAEGKAKEKADQASN